MTKLIFGCGYLGKHVAELWHQDGHRVAVTTRSPEHAREFRQRGWEPIVCDVLQRESLAGLPQADTILFCIGFDRSSGATMRQVYVDGLRNVLDFLPRPNRFIHISSTSVYGQCAGEEVDENSPTNPAFEAGRIVLDAEEVVRSKLPEAIVLRFSGIYGPGRWLRRQSIQAGEVIAGDPDKWVNLIHVADGAAAILAAESRGRAGEVCNVSDDRPVKRRDFYNFMAKALGAPEPLFADPGQAANPRDLANRRIRNGKIKSELGVELTYPNYEQGLR